MRTPRIDAAEQLRTRIETALKSELPDAIATLNSLEVGSAARHGAALIIPPELEFPTGGTEFNASWQVHLVAGPARDYLQAWPLLDWMIEILLEHGFPITKATAASFQPQMGDTLPAYTLTIPE